MDRGVGYGRSDGAEAIEAGDAPSTGAPPYAHRDPLAKISAESAQEVMARSEDMDLYRLVSTIWRAKWIIALVGVLGIVAAHVQLSRTTPLYKADAEVLWEYQRTNLVDIDPVSSSGRADYFLLQSQIEIIRSAQLLGKVVEELNLAQDPFFNPALRGVEGGGFGFGSAVSAAIGWVKGLAGLAAPAEARPEPTAEALREQVIRRLRSMVRADWVERSYVIRITVTASEPERAASLANTVAEYYILDQLEKKFEATRTATAWLSDRVAELRADVEAAEQAVKRFSSASELVSEEALALDARQVKELRDRATTLDARMAELDRLRAGVTSAKASGDLLRVAELLRQPRLVVLVEDLAAGAAEPAEAAAEADALVAQAVATLSADRDRAAEQLMRIRESVAAQEARLARTSDAFVEQNQLEREAEASRLIYESFLSRLKETTVAQGVQQADARLISEAWVPGRPSSPNRGATYAIGLAGGVFLAIVGIVLRERMNASFRTADDLEARTGHAVLGSLPLAPIPKRGALMSFLVERPGSGFAEAVRNLRTSVLLANVDKPPQLIMVCSGLPGEGKTTCCLSLAQISRSLGKRVVIIECDLRRRNFRRYFKIETEGGLLSVLSGHKAYHEVVHVDEATGLHVLPGEQSSVNAADVFASHRFAEFLNELRRHYDYIFVDTPPVLAVPDARVIAQNVDALLYLVHWNTTLRETVAQGLRNFQQVNVKVTGLVLSQIDVKEMTRYGYKAYGYYRQASRYYQD
ncbi:MAG: GumC family protein [Paracoccaceae bacterium]